MAATVNKKRRLKADSAHSESNRLAAKINSKRRWDTDSNYREKKREAARTTAQSKSMSRKKTTCTISAKVPLTRQQHYWRRRARLLAGSRQRQNELSLQHKMSRLSNVSSFYVTILWKKSQQVEKSSCRILKYNHTKLSQKQQTLYRTQTTANAQQRNT